MEKLINTTLIHRKIYDPDLVYLVDKDKLDDDNGIDLFITHEYNNFIIQNYKDKISPILGYRFNFADGRFNYTPLAIYSEKKQFLQPYHTYTYDSNLQLINNTNIFNSFDMCMHIYNPTINIMNILEKNILKFNKN